MATQECPVCSSVVPDTARTCPTCGAPLEQQSAGGDDTRLAAVLPTGTRLNQGSFSIGKVLGRGGFGVTYLGADLRLKRSVAIKEFFPAGSSRLGASVVLPGVLSRADYDLTIEKFTQEAQMVARFRHRSIVNVYEVFQENDTAYMVMEYLQGENLLERMQRRGAPLAESELVEITEPVTEALDEIHAAGVLHRDIKPENIMLVGADDAPRPVLIDFGAAREFASGAANRHSIVLTPGYAPLEQYGEQSRRGPFTDIYALAATLYHMATGQQPPVATERVLGVALKPPRTLNPALSAGFDAALMHGMEIKVDQRPQSARQFYRELAGRDAAPAPAPAVPAARAAPAARSRAAAAPAPPAPVPAPPAPPPPPAPAPLPAPTAAGLERVRQIARQLGGAGPVETDRFICPVCRVAALRQRFSAAELLLCPVCSRGDLQPVNTERTYANVLFRCPACRSGSVVVYAKSQMLVLPDLRGKCNNCGADFDYHAQDDSVTLDGLPDQSANLDPEWVGQTKSRTEWAAIAGDAAGAYLCPACGSELHACPDAGLELVAVAGDPGRVPREQLGRCRSLTE